jgi:hypothetical protein
MADWNARWQGMMTDLERQRDELKLKLHLARADGRDEWDRLEQKLGELRLRAEAARSEAGSAAADVGAAAERLATEVREALDRVRKTL